MNSKEISKGIVWAILNMTGIAILCWLVFQLKTLIIYIIIAGFVSLIGRPINRLLVKRLKIKSVFASSITILFLISIIMSIFFLFVPLLIQQGENLSLLDLDIF